MSEYSIVLKLLDNVARGKESETLVSEVSRFHTKGIDFIRKVLNYETPDTRTQQTGEYNLYRTIRVLWVGL